MSETAESLYLADQQDRENYPEDPNDPEIVEIDRRDAERLKKARDLVASGKLHEPEDLHYLSYIFQHGLTADDYAQALTLAQQAVEAGWPPELSLVPQATDRLMIQQQLDKDIDIEETVQRFGTQTYTPDGKTIKPPLDGKLTEEEREKYGY